MSKPATGPGVVKGLARPLASAKGAALAVAATVFIIAAAGLGFWSFRGGPPTGPLAGAGAGAGAAATAPTALTPTPTLAPPATPVPTARPFPTPPTAVPPPTPPATAAPGPPQLTVTPYNYVYETSCRGTFPTAITVTNTGGGTLTWQISQKLQEDYGVYVTAWGGSLGAGQSQQVTPYWDSSLYGAGPIPPTGGIPVAFTSNGGDQTVNLECAPS